MSKLIEIVARMLKYPNEVINKYTEICGSYHRNSRLHVCQRYENPSHGADEGEIQEKDAMISSQLLWLKSLPPKLLIHSEESRIKIAEGCG